MKKTMLMLLLMFVVIGCDDEPKENPPEISSLVGEWYWINTIRDTLVETVTFTADSMDYRIYDFRDKGSNLYGTYYNVLHDEYFVTSDTMTTWSPFRGLSSEKTEFRKEAHWFKVDNDTLYTQARYRDFHGVVLTLPEKLIRGGKNQWIKELQ